MSCCSRGVIVDTQARHQLRPMHHLNSNLPDHHNKREDQKLPESMVDNNTAPPLQCVTTTADQTPQPGQSCTIGHGQGGRGCCNWLLSDAPPSPTPPSQELNARRNRSVQT